VLGVGEGSPNTPTPQHPNTSTPHCLNRPTIPGVIASNTQSAGRVLTPIRSWIRPLILGIPLGLCALPAAAELQVRVSRPVTGQYEPVGITVTDPLGGLDAHPGPLTMTMADSHDARQTLYLEPTGLKPGQWTGRFTPLKTGRYTGTVVLERGEERDIGLVPLIRVRASGRPGFLRVQPDRRILKYSSGERLFPVGVRLCADDLCNRTDWHAEFRKLRGAGVNYVEIPVPDLSMLPDAEQREVLGTVFALLIDAERAGGPVIQVRFQLPPPPDGSAGPFEEHVLRCVRFWSHSPALAAWRIAGGGAVPPDDYGRLVRLIRSADAYRHPIVVPQEVQEALADREARADLVAAPCDWQQPANRAALLEAPETSGEAGEPHAPSPGEASWQMLVQGGVGLPLWRYHPGAPETDLLLQRIACFAQAARSIPFEGKAYPLSGVLPEGSLGSFCRYGKSLAGWLVPETDAPLMLPSLPRGRYRVRFWDAAKDSYAGDAFLWSDGGRTPVDLPAGLEAVCLLAEPAPALGVKR
jgi:hypothetical protein